jgi:hypothetical protein
MIIRGESCTIFFDKNMRFFIIAPIRNKQEFADRPGRYDYIVDLPAISASGTAGTKNAHGSVEKPQGDVEGSEGSDEAEKDYDLDSEEMDLDGPSPSASGSAQSTKKIPRPPNSWILFRRDKSKELREANPNMSTGEVSIEAARQWKVLSDEDKGFYQEMAKQAALQHKIQYPDYVYKPGRK